MEGKLPFGFLSGGSSQYFTAAGSTTELSTIARGMRQSSQMSSDALGNLKASSEDMSFKIDDISSAISYYKKNAPRGCADRGDGVNCCAIPRSR